MDAHQPAVVLIDLQHAFFSTGPLEPRAQEIITKCNELQDWAARNQVPVFQVRTEHLADRSTWTLNMLADDQGFLIAGDDDAQPLTGLDTDGAIEVVKTRDSAFHRTGFADLLRTHGVDLLVMAGASTHTCVATTAADAYAHDLDVVFVDDAIASHRPDLHDPTLDMLCDEFRFRRLLGADIINAPEDELFTRPTPHQ